MYLMCTMLAASVFGPIVLLPLLLTAYGRITFAHLGLQGMQSRSFKRTSRRPRSGNPQASRPRQNMNSQILQKSCIKDRKAPIHRVTHGSWCWLPAFHDRREVDRGPGHLPRIASKCRSFRGVRVFVAWLPVARLFNRCKSYFVTPTMHGLLLDWHGACKYFNLEVVAAFVKGDRNMLVLSPISQV